MCILFHLYATYSFKVFPPNKWCEYKPASKAKSKTLCQRDQTSKTSEFSSLYCTCTVCISMTTPHCICCPSCRLEIHSDMMCFVCLTLEHCLPRGQVTSSLWSVLCSFFCALACRGTVRLPLTLSVLRMWMWNHLHTVYVCDVCVGHLSPCARCSRPGSNCVCKRRMEGPAEGYRLVSLTCTAPLRQTQ